MLPTKFRFIWPSGFTEYFFSRNRSIGNKNGLWRLCLLTDWDEICNLIEDLLYMLPTKFGFIWGSGFRREDFLEIYQSEKRIASGGHVCKRQHAHRFFHLEVHVPFYLLLWVYIQIFGGAMYPLTLHLILGVQRKWTAFFSFHMSSLVKSYSVYTHTAIHFCVPKFQPIILIYLESFLAV